MPGIQERVDDHVTSIMVENSELTRKLLAVEEFMRTRTFSDLHEEDQYLLAAQVTTMQSYSAILSARLLRATNHGVQL